MSSVFPIPKNRKRNIQITTTYYISTAEFENLTRALQRQKKKKKCALSKVKIHIKGYTVNGSTKFRPKIGGLFVS